MKKTVFLLLLFCIFAFTACGNTTAVYKEAYVNMTLSLPDGWAYETPHDQTGIRFWPEEDPSAVVSMLYSDPFPDYHENTDDAFTLLSETLHGDMTLYTESDGTQYRIFADWLSLPEGYCAKYTFSGEQYRSYGETVQTILENAVLSEGILTRDEAYAIVLQKYSAEQITSQYGFFGTDGDIRYYHFLSDTGVWEFYILMPDGESNLFFRISADGSSITETPEEPIPVIAKPVIYLYPRESTDVTVRLSGVDLICTYPAYNAGWSVTASPDGTLLNHADGQEYSYLFWEGLGTLETDVSEGFCIRGEDTAVFLQETLSALGLTPREYNEFIVWWLPQMQDNPYNLITFAWEDYDASAPLEISPVPDTTLRVFMVWQAADSFVDIPAPILPAAPERVGFTVIEWGGMEIAE